MDLEEAIRTALSYEHRVLAVYREAAESTAGPVGRDVFESLAEEEQGHVDYLEAKLEQWRQTGRITPTELKTVLPSEDAVAEGVAKLQQNPTAGAQEAELEMLKKALEAETETSEFYERMVAELDAEGRALFEPFVNIERAHRALVQAEIDALTGTGFWFDMAEFRLDAG
jgi:rubrerythrin